MEEVWKDIEGYEGLYQVSNIGNVKSMNYGGRGISKLLKPGIGSNGYFRVILYKDSVRKTGTIHRLVAESFIPNPYDKPEIDHIDTIPTNNNVDNLKWCTRVENRNNYLTKINYSLCKKGEKSSLFGKFGALHNGAVPVIQYSKNGEFIAEYGSIVDAARAIGIDKSHITKVCKNNGKNFTAGGFVWRYKNETTD